MTKPSFSGPNGHDWHPFYADRLIDDLEGTRWICSKCGTQARLARTGLHGAQDEHWRFRAPWWMTSLFMRQGPDGAAAYCHSPQQVVFLNAGP